MNRFPEYILASMLFGLTYIRTKSLALPIGMHFMANWTQGSLLGFGVSGNHEESLLTPEFLNTSDLFTGGMFGLKQVFWTGIFSYYDCPILFIFP
ncbi:MAG: CPBP family intramembrane metalloprotease [Bacteroidetes bacterium]|nr:CPBP family intramembrane metalloprotease [Bacteroidota bacterium]